MSSTPAASRRLARDLHPLAALDGDVAHGGERRLAGGPDGRRRSGDERHDEAHQEAVDEGARHEGDAVDREVAAAAERREHATGEEVADDEPEAGGERRDHRGLEEDGGEHLPAAGADGPEQRQLPRALGQEDLEGVVDDEHADQQREAGEGDEDLAEEGEAARHGVGGLLAVGRAGERLGALGQRGADGRHDVVVGDAVGGPHEDGGELAAGAGELDRLVEREVERDGAATALGVAEGEGADQRELLAARLRGDGDGVAHGDPGVLRGLHVDGDLAGLGRGPAPLGEVVGVQHVVVDPRLDERRRALGGADRLALGVEELGAVGGEDDVGLGVGDAVDGAHGVEHRGVEPGPLVAGEVVAEGQRTLDDGVDVLGGLGEQAVEGLLDGVAEHQRAGHEGHAEHHRHDGGDEPSLVAPEGAEGDLAHGQPSPNCFMRSSTLSAVGSSMSSTIFPSARKSTWSA